MHTLICSYGDVFDDDVGINVLHPLSDNTEYVGRINNSALLEGFMTAADDAEAAMTEGVITD